MIYYKYVNSLESLNSILIHQTLKVTSPKDFNDPCDCIFPNPKFNTKNVKIKIKELIKKIPDFKKLKGSDIKSDIDSLIKEIARDFKYLFNNLRDKEWQDIIEEVRILSFTSQKDNILMWSHYANSHSGFVLGFDFKENEDIYKNIKEVKYGENYIDKFANQILDILFKLFKKNFAEIIFDTKKSDEILNKNSVKIQQFILQTFIQNIIEDMWIKKDVWSYEKEYKLVLNKNSTYITNINNIECIPFKRESLKEIIFGLKNEIELSALNLYIFNIELYRAKNINGNLVIKKLKND